MYGSGSVRRDFGVLGAIRFRELGSMVLHAHGVRQEADACRNTAGVLDDRCLVGRIDPLAA
jgi:hypothetical protein